MIVLHLLWLFLMTRNSQANEETVGHFALQILLFCEISFIKTVIHKSKQSHHLIKT